MCLRLYLIKNRVLSQIIKKVKRFFRIILIRLKIFHLKEVFRWIGKRSQKFTKCKVKRDVLQKKNYFLSKPKKQLKKIQNWVKNSIKKIYLLIRKESYQILRKGQVNNWRKKNNFNWFFIKPLILISYVLIRIFIRF